MGFAEDLIADGPSDSLSDNADLFAPLIGRWRIRNALFTESAGTWSRSELQWTFQWIIGGHGIQDVLVDEGNRAIGTTVRTWDRKAGWRVVWFCPLAAEHVVLTAAAVRDEIRLDGVQADGRVVRWEFSAVTHDSFVWDGWCSDDAGATWWHEQHMDADRVA